MLPDAVDAGDLMALCTHAHHAHRRLGVALEEHGNQENGERVVEPAMQWTLIQSHLARASRAQMPGSQGPGARGKAATAAPVAPVVAVAVRPHTRGLVSSRPWWCGSHGLRTSLYSSSLDGCCTVLLP